MPTSPITVQCVLPPERTAVREARHLVQDTCDQALLDADCSGTAVLLTSECVTNAVLHGRSSVRLLVIASSTTAHIEVGDDNSRHPSLREEDDDALDGRGMTLVDALAGRWGVRDELLGKTVWFDCP